MSDFPGLAIEPGEIRLNYALKVIDEERVKIWEIDLHSKYAEVLAYGGDEHGQPQILLHAGEYTLGLEESLRGAPTRITLVGLDGDHWTLVTDLARYTQRVVAYCAETEDR